MILGQKEMTRILIIEDEDGIRKVLKLLLERAGYIVSEAADGNIATELYTNEPFDLVITDIFMPKKDGLQVIREIKRDYSKTKLIAMSGGGTVDVIGAERKNYLVLAKKMGVHKTLEKPFDLQEILLAVKELVG